MFNDSLTNEKYYMLPKSAKGSENIFDEDPGPNTSSNSGHGTNGGGTPNIFIYA